MHVITGLETGGAEVMLHKLVSRSSPEQFRHAVVSLMEIGPVGQEIAGLGVPVQSLHMRAGVPDPRAVLRLNGILRQAKPDVVQTWLYHADFLGLLGGRSTRIPVVWNIRGALHRDLGRVTKSIARVCALLSRLPAAVVTNSETARAHHAQLGYRPREWLVIPNGFDIERFTPDVGARTSVRRELGLPPDALVIGMVGRFHPVKDHPTFQQAASMVSQQCPEVQFVLVGRGLDSENRVLHEARQNTVPASRLHLLGERQDIPRLTAAFDIATNSSVSESFSNAIGEAMACGVPCVVTNVGDSAQIVGGTGRVAPPRDPLAIAAAWQDLIKLGPVGRHALGQQARARVEERYSLDAIVRQYEALYARIANAHRC